MQQVRALEDLMSQDLARVIPVVDGAPAPFAGEPPIAIDRKLVNPAPGDPAVSPWPVEFGRCSDYLQLYSTVSDIGKTPDGKSGLSVIGRGIVKYMLDPATGTTTGNGATDPKLVQPVSGGPAVGRLRRYVKVTSSLHPTPTVVPAAPEKPSVIVDNVISFQLDYLTGQSLDSESLPGSRSTDVFKIPEPDTASGEAFKLNGQVTLDCGILGPRLMSLASDAAMADKLLKMPIGTPVFLKLRADTATEQPPAQMFLVRGRQSVSPTQSAIFLNDRPIQEDPAPSLRLKAFLPPVAIRLTIVVLFGKGVENQTARFVRVIPVPR